MPRKTLYERFVEQARRHGEESEPDMEVGDLQHMLLICLNLMTPEQKKMAATKAKEWMG
jgi:hypothetical protein